MQKFYRKFLQESLVELPASTQIIGVATRQSLEPEILALFNVIVPLERPRAADRYGLLPAAIVVATKDFEPKAHHSSIAQIFARLELIADDLSRRHAEHAITRMPQRLFELSQVSETIERRRNDRKKTF